MINKDEIQKTFNTIYPDKRLLALHLNGFSHAVIFDDGTQDSEIQAESYSGYAPEQPWSPKAKQLLEGIPHYTYQNNAKEIVFIGKNER